MTTTQTNTVYREGGWLPDAPDENILVETEQDFDENGVPVGEPRVVVDNRAE